MKHRRRQAICIGLVGVALALVPLTAASAHKKQNHSSNSSNAICQDVSNEQASESAPSPQVTQALASNNFAEAKQAMLNLYNADLSETQTALVATKSAPSNVQAALKGVLGYVKQVKNDIANASSLQGLNTAFESLGKNTQMDIDAATVESWYTSKCSHAHVTTTTVSIP